MCDSQIILKDRNAYVARGKIDKRHCMRIIGDGDGHAYPINKSNAWRRWFVNAMSKRGSWILRSRMAFHGLRPHLEERHFTHEQRLSVTR